MNRRTYGIFKSLVSLSLLVMTAGTATAGSIGNEAVFNYCDSETQESPRLHAWNACVHRMHSVYTRTYWIAKEWALHEKKFATAGCTDIIASERDGKKLWILDFYWQEDKMCTKSGIRVRLWDEDQALVSIVAF